MKQSNKQAGFSVVIALVALLVVAGAGFAAWRISQSPEQKTATNSDSKTRQEQTSKSELVEDKDKYLVIQEWGVRFTLPQELRGSIIYYADPEQENTMVIDSSKFPEKSECASFSLVRTTEKIENPDDPQGLNSSSFKKIDQFYFSRVTGVIACSNEQQIQEKAAQIQQSLYQATSSLESL